LGLSASFKSFLPKLSGQLAPIRPLLSELATSFVAMSQTHRRLLAWTPFFDLYVTDKYRVLFIIDRDIVVSFSIGPHGIVSK